MTESLKNNDNSLDIKFEKIKTNNLNDYYNNFTKNRTLDLYKTIINDDKKTKHYIGIAVEYSDIKIEAGYIGTIAKIKLIKLCNSFEENISDYKFVKDILDSDINGHFIWNYRTKNLKYELVLDKKSEQVSYQYSNIDNTITYLLNTNIMYLCNSKNYIHISETFIITKFIDNILGYNTKDYTIFTSQLWNSIYPNIID
jgi:hypothetical protein